MTAREFTRKPMPESRERLEMAGGYSREQFERIKAGHVSQDMDDKWDIGFEEPWLFFCRSWTGTCIYQLRLEQVGGKMKITEAWVNRDPEQYRSPSLEFDRTFPLELIRGRLLDEAR